MDRRGFIRVSCFGCASIAIGAGLLPGCSTALPLAKVECDGDLMRVPIALFATTDKVIARTARLPDDVLLIRHADGTFSGVYLRCTHRDQPLSATPTGLHCPSHGSRFGLDGMVLEGPATERLLTFKTTVDGDSVTVHLVG